MRYRTRHVWVRIWPIPMHGHNLDFDSEVAMGGDYAASHVIAEDGNVKVYEPWVIVRGRVYLTCDRLVHRRPRRTGPPGASPASV